MSDKESPVEPFKRALINTMRTISENQELAVSFGTEPPGLRGLQNRGELSDLLGRVLNARQGTTPVLLKIAPDLVPEEREDIAAVVLESGIDGLIVSNTTIAREGLVSGLHAEETGGLSGKPLMSLRQRCWRTCTA